MKRSRNLPTALLSLWLLTHAVGCGDDERGNGGDAQIRNDATVGSEDAAQSSADAGSSDANGPTSDASADAAAPRADDVSLDFTLELEVDGITQTKQVQLNADFVDRQTAACDEPAISGRNNVNGGGPKASLDIGTEIYFCEPTLKVAGVDGLNSQFRLLVPLEQYTGTVAWNIQLGFAGDLTQSGSYWRYRDSGVRIEITNWQKVGEQVIADGTFSTELTDFTCQGTEEECARYGASAELFGTYQLGITP